MTRDELQKQAIDTLINEYRVIVNWGTGVGKSRVAIGCANRLYAAGNKRILLLVAETAHKKNWLNEFKEALGQRGEQLYNALTVECYASLPKYEWSSWDFIIADEAHHLRSENRSDIISTIHTKYFLCLSATMSCDGDADELFKVFDMVYGNFVNLNFGIQDAIDNNILAEPKVYVHKLTLQDMSVRQEIVEEWGLAKKRVLIRCMFEDKFKYSNRSNYPHATLVISATPQQAYDYYTSKMKYYKARWQQMRNQAGLHPNDPETKESSYMWSMYIRNGNLRKNVMGSAKTVFSKWLLKALGNKKYVCFCSDIKQARELGGDKMICSEKDDNMEVIDAFNRGDIRSLFAVNMIQEGQNLSGIQAGVVIQLSGKERQFVQKFGRALRSKEPEQHIIVIVNTRDMDFYNTAIDGFDKKYIIEKYYGTAKKVEENNSAMIPDENLPGLSMRAVSA